MFNRNHVIASARKIRYSLNGITRKQWITCGTVFATVYLLSAIYILFRPGNYIEPGTLCPFIITAAIYSAALSCALIRRDAWARMIYFAFPPVLLFCEWLNFSPIEQFYSVCQLYFAMLLAVWCWGTDAVCGDLLGRIHRTLRVLPTLILGFLLYLLPLTIIAHHIANGRKFTYDSIQAVYQTELAEGLYYFLTHFFCLLLFVLLLLAAAGLFLLNRIGTPRRNSRAFSCILVLMLLCLSPALYGELTGIDALNRTKVLFTDSLQYFAVIEQYAASGAARRKAVERHVVKNSGSDGIYVLIIGESHNKNHCSAYGYGLDTTPFMKAAAREPGFILMKNAFSCHVQTMQVISYLLTAHNQYIRQEDGVAPSIFDVLKYCSCHTVFLSNQYPHGRFDSPVAALASGADKCIWLNTMEDFILWRARPDEALLEPFSQQLNSKRSFIVLHLMGNHGPYARRYPAGFGDNLAWSAYDKSVLYVDGILEKIFSLLRKNPYVKAAVYLSDHSEKPGVGHGADAYEQEIAEIPMLLYLSESLRKERPGLEETLRSNADCIFTNDLTFELLLDLMGIKHTFGSPQTRIALPSYDMPFDKARTLLGARKLDGAEIRRR